MQKQQKRFWYTTVSAFVAALVLVGAAYMQVGEQRVADAGKPYFKNAITVTNPKPPQVREYAPGSDIPLRLDFDWIYCANEGGGAVYGRTSNIVPADKPLPAPKGAWRAGVAGWPGTAGPAAKGKEQAYAPRKGVYSENLRAPMKPGKYQLAYEIELRTPEGNLSRQGRVVFEVRDKERNPGANCPANQITIRQNGGLVCVPNTVDVDCDVSSTQVDVGESVTFSASTAKTATFTWYEGPHAGGTVLAGPKTGTQSTLTRTFSRAGQYQVTVLAKNAQGSYGACTRGVRVGSLEDEIEEEEVTDEFGNIFNSVDGTIMTPDGQILTIDPSAPPASVTLTFDRALTNTTCAATWQAQNVLRCYMVRGNERTNAPVIGASGTEQVVPATYRVDCLARRDGKIVSSETRICSNNPDAREQ
ncbi:MAG: hypothetical protein RL150_339 [Candidatus Parcubacteria bacterium]